MISEIYILFFKASLTIRHTATLSQKKSGTSKKIQWDFQISRVGSLDFLDLKVNGSPGSVGVQWDTVRVQGGYSESTVGTVRVYWGTVRIQLGYSGIQ